MFLLPLTNTIFVLHLGPVVLTPAHANFDANDDADTDTDVDAHVDAAATLAISRIPLQPDLIIQLIQQYSTLVILIILAINGHVIANVHACPHDDVKQSLYRPKVS